MKKRSFLVSIIIVLICLFTLNIDVKAESMAYFLKCPEEVTKGKVFSCDVYIQTNSSAKVTNITGSITQNSTILLDHYEKGKYITNEKIVYHSFNYTSDEGVPNGETIFKVYVKVDKNTKYQEEYLQLFINEIKLKDGSTTSNIDLKSNKITFLTNPNPESSECHLESITVSDGTLSPNFDMDKLEYSLTTEKDELTITAKPLDNVAKVEISNIIDNKVKLNIGKNNINIKVTAEDGTEKVYKLTITRNETKKEEPTTNNKNDNTKLQLLSVDGEKIQLKDNTFNYSIDVPYETSNANLLYAASSSTSKIDITGSENLKVGENSIIIKVTAESGTSSKYYLTINRANEVKSNDSSIKKLEVLNADSFNFSSDNQNYIIKVPKKVDKLKLNIELTSSKATYDVTGNENLKNNSKVIIKVTADDGSTTTYSLLIEKNKTDNLMTILIILIAVLIAIIVGIVVIITNKKNKDKDNNKSSSKIELDNPEFDEENS